MYNVFVIEGGSSGGRRPREEREVVDVRMDEVKTVFEGEIRTGGLHTCVGLCLHDGEKRAGPIGHLSEYTREEVHEIIVDFLGTIGADPAIVKARLRGAAPLYGSEEIGISPKDARDYAQITRTEAEEGVRMSGILPRNTDTQWLNDNTQTVSMELDSRSGRFTSWVEDNPYEAF